MIPSDLAKIITAAMADSDAEGGPGHVDDEDLTFAIIDGKFDMLKVAEIVLNTINQISTK